MQPFQGLKNIILINTRNSLAVIKRRDWWSSCGGRTLGENGKGLPLLALKI